MIGILFLFVAGNLVYIWKRVISFLFLEEIFVEEYFRFGFLRVLRLSRLKLN
jgi:hypothetical protein